MALLALLLGLAVLIAHQPTCEERGGKLQFLYFQPVIVGKSTILIPHYHCKLPAK